MPHDPEKYLHDMLEAGAFLLEFTEGHDAADLRTDRGFRSAVERELQIIGEALIQLTKFHPTIAERITEHQRIIRFRHVLVHGYDILDPDVVWSIVVNKLPSLKAEVENLLGTNPDRGRHLDHALAMKARLVDWMQQTGHPWLPRVAATDVR